MSAHFRSLIIIQSSVEQLIPKYSCLREQIKGHWITISTHQAFENQPIQLIAATKAKQLLGQEFKHALFDATDGFNLESFAMLCGTLVADSILLLLLPEDFDHWLDKDSLRWNEQDTAIEVPNFIVHLQSVIKASQALYTNNIFCIKINNLQIDSYLFDLIAQNFKLTNSAFKYQANQQQYELLSQLKESQSRIHLVTAKRGRGKSALAGMLTNHVNAWVTAPNKNAIQSIRKFAEKDLRFFAPDELIIHLAEKTARPDWLIIDEAAMIPLPMLQQLINQNYRVLLTSTTDGYEGTGQGLWLKLLQQLDGVANYQLSEPIRWESNDPVEDFIDHLTLTQNDEKLLQFELPKIQYEALKQAQLVSQPNRLFSFFNLLKTAHYRTTLIDLRRLLDAQKIKLFCAKQGNDITAALIAVKEGGLSGELVEQIWNGTRRPKGNLVAQSLVAHAGQKQAAKLRSVRVNRIAVHESLRRRSIASTLIEILKEEAKKEQLDFISVSFAYSSEMKRFWQSVGFTIIHIGTHQEASSASYAAMAIYPLSSAGKALQQTLQNKLSRDWFWFKELIEIEFDIEITHDQELNQQDRLDLEHFATTFYPYTASFAVLSRLAHYYIANDRVTLISTAPLLNALIIDKIPTSEVAKKYQLSGKTEVIKLLRNEVLNLITVKGKF